MQRFGYFLNEQRYRLCRSVSSLVMAGMLSFLLAVTCGSLGLGRVLSFSPTSSIAQQHLPFPRPEVPVLRSGDLDYTAVVLDGRPLFQIAAAAVADVEGSGRIRPVQHRAERIETLLYGLLATGFDSQTLKVAVARLNRQTVILATDDRELSQRIILTVTESDGKIAQQSVPELAADWSETIRQALIQGLAERHPEVRARRLKQMSAIALGTLTISFVLIGMQRRLKARFNQLQSQAALAEPAIQEPGNAPISLSSSPASASGSTPSASPLAVPLQVLDALLPQLHLNRQRDLNMLQRRGLQLAQAVIWLGGAVWSLQLFPETRAAGSWLFAFPIKFLTIYLAINLANKVTDIAIDFSLQTWLEQTSLVAERSQRLAQRVPTLAAALKGLTDAIAFILGCIWLLAWLQIPLGAVLAGAGLLGAVLTLVFQNLLKDAVTGMLILLEDQYTVGDFIDVGVASGVVESMNLRTTQLRGAGGRLTVVPNNQIATVHNLTKGWSRVEFSVDVAYDTNATRAMQIMKQLAEELQQEPIWQGQILDPGNMLGISQIDGARMQLTIWIKTRPMEQWAVEREFRHRLKLAFDRAGIMLSLPEQVLWLQDSRKCQDDNQNHDNCDRKQSR